MYLANLGSNLFLSAYFTVSFRDVIYNMPTERQYWILHVDLGVMIKYSFLITGRFYLIRLRDNIVIIISFQFNDILLMNSSTNFGIGLEIWFERVIGDFSVSWLWTYHIVWYLLSIFNSTGIPIPWLFIWLISYLPVTFSILIFNLIF